VTEEGKDDDWDAGAKDDGDDVDDEAEI